MHFLLQSLLLRVMVCHVSLGHVHGRGVGQHIYTDANASSYHTAVSSPSWVDPEARGTGGIAMKSGIGINMCGADLM